MTYVINIANHVPNMTIIRSFFTNKKTTRLVQNYDFSAKIPYLCVIINT